MENVILRKEITNESGTLQIISDFERQQFKKLILCNNDLWTINNIEFSIEFVVVKYPHNKPYHYPSGSITFTQLKTKDAKYNKLKEHIYQEMKKIDIKPFIDKDVDVELQTPYIFKAQSYDDIGEFNWNHKYGDSHTYLITAVRLITYYSNQTKKSINDEITSNMGKIANNDNISIEEKALILKALSKGLK